MTAFIISAGLLAPLISSFPDAAAVTILRGEAYWSVWSTRFLSNVLTEITLAPALVSFVRNRLQWIREAPVRRRIEASIFLVALFVVGRTLFASHGSVVPVLGLVLPLLLWASVRFGPAAVGFSVLAVADLAISGATAGEGPIIAMARGIGVRDVQILLIVLAVPLMYLAAITEERRKHKENLEKQLSFEELLSRLSARFIRVQPSELNAAIREWLGRLGDFLDVDRVSLLRLSDGGQTMEVLHTGGRHQGSLPTRVAQHDFPWVFEQVRRTRAVVLPRLGDLPAGASPDRDSLERTGIQSVAIFPLLDRVNVFGALVVLSISAERTWPADLVQSLRLVAEVFASSLLRRQIERALKSSEEMKSAILASLPVTIAVLDRQGLIIAVNGIRTRGGRSRVPLDSRLDVGVSYLDACRQSAGQFLPSVEEAVAEIGGVLDRRRTGGRFEYLWRAFGQTRWFAVWVVPLSRTEGGAVVSHTEITDVRLAELEAQRSREELSHFNRVSTMGELVGSLAHELNQPLAAILSNAQAARRFADSETPNLEELNSILADIVADDKRAGDVIRRLRLMLSRSDLQPDNLDLNSLVCDVIMLVRSEMIIRNVSLELDLGAEAPLVRGDRIQLQQVLLNLLINAMEAMNTCEAPKRKLIIRTRSVEQKLAHVMVEDAGTGFQDHACDLIFEPFYTTKPSGMGMGLSISRSIIQAHNGVIWASNNPARGATFHFTVPLAAST
jgi:signal transduction histidine kinase